MVSLGIVGVASGIASMSFKVEYKGKVADIYRCSELVNSSECCNEIFLVKLFKKQRKVKRQKDDEKMKEHT